MTDAYAYEDEERDRSLDIAVTGMAGRFPGAAGIEPWWQALLRGEILTTRMGRDELLAAGESPRVVDSPDYVPVRGLLDDADRFDHELFGISPREAALMDPQQRLMLETAWQALEDAGCDPTQEQLVTGVYASASSSAYLRAMLTSNTLDAAGVEEALRANEPDYMATRIAYRLGLTGPALTALTACSSSLVAVHLAVQALLNGECEQAVVVAAAVDFPQLGHVHLPGGILSASGSCRPFDADADGALAGSGVAAVVLRRYEDAAEAGCDPYGLIIGTAVNNDGRAKAGYQAPSATGQEAVVRSALAAAGIGADALGYLEAHATGTRVGDPIEWSAASSVLRELGAAPGQIAVGAVKANIGHLDAASGLVSLIKTLLVVRHGQVPPVAGFRTLNPLLETAGSPLRVPAAGFDWDAGDAPRRAGVSSFGIGGTNAHVVVEQAPALVQETAPVRDFEAGAPDDEHLLVVSAATPDALRDSALRIAAWLPCAQSTALGDTARTLATGRATLPYRTAVTGRSRTELAERLRDATPSRADGPAPHVVFLLPGQGSQYPGMARPFADALPGFTDLLDDCLAHLARLVPGMAARLRTALFDPDFPAAELERTELAQVALFCVEYAAATALGRLGLAPAALAGHSLGEFTAAALSGVLGLADALALVTARGRAMGDCPTGAMAAVAVREDRARELAAAYGLEVAAVNTPESCVLAGPASAVKALGAGLEGREKVRVLRTSHAFHTSLLDPAVPRIEDAARPLPLGPVTVPYLSNATGALLPAGSRVEARAFAEQARSTVRFADGLAAIARAYPGAVCVEVGPGQALSGMAVAAGLTAVPLGGRQSTLEALGGLWAAGLPLDPAALTRPGHPVHLPGYPFAGPRLLAPAAAVRAPHGDADAGEAPPVPEPAVPGGPAPTSGEGTPGEGTSGEPTPGERVSARWAELLGRTGLDPDADFFDLGGDSLLVVRLAQRLGQDLGVRVPVRELLTGPTLAQHIALAESLLLAGDHR
ncbi:MAG: acyltransferase domain-containing protein [Streptomyces sp.]|nr:acyltransferase domain-containing protein [Streptomyces sp.]